MMHTMMCALCIYFFVAIIHSINAQGSKMQFKFQETSPNWVILKSSTGIKFTPRNAHATCIYQNKIWITGGKTDLYKMYNTLFSYKAGDVWNSADSGGGNWEQQVRVCVCVSCRSLCICSCVCHLPHCTVCFALCGCFVQPTDL